MIKYLHIYFEFEILCCLPKETEKKSLIQSLFSCERIYGLIQDIFQFICYNVVHKIFL